MQPDASYGLSTTLEAQGRSICHRRSQGTLTPLPSALFSHPFRSPSSHYLPNSLCPFSSSIPMRLLFLAAFWAVACASPARPSVKTSRATSTPTNAAYPTSTAGANLCTVVNHLVRLTSLPSKSRRDGHLTAFDLTRLAMAASGARQQSSARPTSTFQKRQFPPR